MLGIVPHGAASILGLAVLHHAGAVVFQVVKFVSVAFLLWMTWQVWRGTGARSVEGRPERLPA